MKRVHLRCSWQAPSLAIYLLLSLADRSAAQCGNTNYLWPVVSIQATDPIANLSGDTGTFTVFRDGPTNASLFLYYCIAGTASNGVDYVQIGNFVSIPAGACSNTVTIKPINHGQTNPIETVVLTLCPSPLMIPINYTIGYPTSAVVYLEGPGVTNIPPAVEIAIPTNGAVFYTPVNIPIAAEAFDADGYVATVEFFANTTSLGIRTNNPLSASPVNPFYLVWSNAPPGNYALTALATDNGGAATTSAPVNISVLQSPPPCGNTNYLWPVVSIQATDPIANLSGDTGTFTLFRDGPTNASLFLYYCIGGTASNGVDYVQIGNFVSIPAGACTNTVTITPINHGQTNPVETVVLTLCPSPLMNPVNYIIGSPTSAVVYIEGPGVTNIPPAAKIVIPTNGAIFYTPVNIPIAAEAFDPDGYVATVEFLANTTSLGIRTNNPLSASPVNPFYLVWSNAPPGNYALTALATDNGGAATTSAPVNISVLQGPPPPPTNLPPVVRIISPPDGAIFRAPVDVPIYAYAQDFDGFVTSVEFFADATNSLGLGTALPPPTIVGASPTPLPWGYPTNVYFLIWSNVPLGAHVLTAKATDNGGAFTVSAPVNISILPPPPPPTNQPPIVSIIAIDPVAIEGTNCWPWLGPTNTMPAWSNWLAGTTFCQFFTNCGPKNATFAVRRFGLTNDDLTVTYAIGGTATNGVEYVTLPGSVTIPAGERCALISVVPIDDGPPDITSTVILKLTASTNYIIGLPPAAAAIILDGTWPPVATGLLPDNCFHLSATGPNGAWVRIDYSTDLIDWTTLCVNQVINGSVDFIDPDAQTSPSRFYRVVPQISPPLY